MLPAHSNGLLALYVAFGLLATAGKTSFCSAPIVGPRRKSSAAIENQRFSPDRLLLHAIRAQTRTRNGVDMLGSVRVINFVRGKSSELLLKSVDHLFAHQDLKIETIVFGHAFEMQIYLYLHKYRYKLAFKDSFTSASAVLLCCGSYFGKPFWTLFKMFVEANASQIWSVKINF